MPLFKNILNISLLVVLNLSVAKFFQSTHLAVINTSPSWLFFGVIGNIILFFILVLTCIILQPNAKPTKLIIAAIMSNLIEFYTFGFVVDYINLGIGVLNLADLQIYIGLIWLTVLSLRHKLQSDLT
jgi:lipoprotein signal peptidase